MLEILLSMYEDRPSLFIGLIGLFLIAVTIVLYFVFYIYMNIHLKGISKIIFNNEDKYRRPLEPFNFIFLSFLPTTFWREILNIKYNKSFRKLYGKEFYYRLDESQLKRLMSEYKGYFVFQYVIFIITTFAFIFMIYAYVIGNYFK
ncbi:hypothetical protein [Acinetobacter haemolyticus]|uniref:hypothetical protein n=1 Tax=Acinetobacter haemolyticus TaxID=29430 RepID=UPI000DEA65B2|nr:hypothetical protein [Acinetobacter haemolyticus]WHR58419.1 hypothetical protein PGW89_02930 [Acinetobacter haemolyticus]